MCSSCLCFHKNRLRQVVSIVATFKVHNRKKQQNQTIICLETYILFLFSSSALGKDQRMSPDCKSLGQLYIVVNGIRRLWRDFRYSTWRGAIRSCLKTTKNKKKQKILKRVLLCRSNQEKLIPGLTELSYCFKFN